MSDPFAHRLDPSRVNCPIMRGRLYREIRQQSPRVSLEAWTQHTIAPSERLMPELVALRVYQDHRLKWVVLAAAGLDDYREALESGEALELPSIEWLRDRIRHYERMAKVPVERKPVLAKAERAQ